MLIAVYVAKKLLGGVAVITGSMGTNGLVIIKSYAGVFPQGLSKRNIVPLLQWMVGKAPSAVKIKVA